MAHDPLPDTNHGPHKTAKRVLLVDDEPNIVLSLEFLMQSKGYAVAVARNGEEALRLAAEFRPHLVVLDVMMPAIDGIEVCRRLRADARQQDLKILVLTARGLASDIKRGLDEGANACITKPFATQDLSAAVSELLAATA
jgi:DNA-binding response OmpR family regulator